MAPPLWMNPARQLSHDRGWRIASTSARARAGSNGSADIRRPLPSPGGWNRFALEVADLEDVVASLRRQGARFRNDIVTGVGGKQILLEDPSGNPVELFEPARAEARLSPPSS